MFFVIGLFCTPCLIYPWRYNTKLQYIFMIYLNITLWLGSFVQECCTFNCNTLNEKTFQQIFIKSLVFRDFPTCFKIQTLKKLIISTDCHIKTCRSLKDTHRENAPTNNNSVLTKSMNMDIWVVGPSNQLFIRGSQTETKFSKK